MNELEKIKKICEETDYCSECPFTESFDREYCLFSCFPKNWQTKQITEKLTEVKDNV